MKELKQGETLTLCGEESMAGKDTKRLGRWSGGRRGDSQTGCKQIRATRTTKLYRRKRMNE